MLSNRKKLTESRSTSEEIEQFFLYVRRIFDSATSANFNDFDHVLRPLSYWGIIDSLSCVAFPDDRKCNKKRVTNFIDKFCSWSDAHRISLPHLAELLRNDVSSENLPLKSYCESTLKTWLPGTCISISKDPTIDDIRPLLSHGAGNGSTEVNAVRIESLEHASLLYMMRNNFVHELRSTGYSPWPLLTQPSYMHNTNTSFGVAYWELNYPQTFVESLCKKGINTFEKHCKENDINPIARLRFGPYLCDRLNWQIDFQ
jgi:hypothetical protein